MTPGAILRVGLTGNIGAGKSTVATMLQQAGCLVVDLDGLGHELLARSGSEVATQIIEIFGSEILDASGAIDRQRLGALAFVDDAARRKLERILHPRIRRLEQARVRAWRVSRGIAVTEAALLVETGAYHRYHRLVVVVTPRALRLQRLLERGVPASVAEARMATQWDQQKKVRVADYVLDNSGRMTAIRAAVRRLLLKLRRDLEDLVSDRPLPPTSEL